MKHIVLLLCIISGALWASSTDTYIPKNAYRHLPTVKSEVVNLKTEFSPGYVAGIITQESCITLYHSRCWKSTSEYRTRTEQGVGLGQLTRTWRRNGRIRFDKLTELTRKFRTRLAGLTWRTIRSRPDLQIRAIVLMLNDDWHHLPKTVNTANKELMIASAYNQGLGGLKLDRRACGLKRGCNSTKWYGHVANIKRSRGFAYAKRRYLGNRSFWDVNRQGTILKLRHKPKFDRYYQTH